MVKHVNKGFSNDKANFLVFDICLFHTFVYYKIRMFLGSSFMHLYVHQSLIFYLKCRLRTFFLFAVCPSVCL